MTDIAEESVDMDKEQDGFTEGIGFVIILVDMCLPALGRRQRPNSLASDVAGSGQGRESDPAYAL